MNNLENLNKLAKEIHEGNKLRGFDASEENIGQTLMLVVSELSEALEADRKDRYADLLSFESERFCEPESLLNEDSVFKVSFEKKIKDTFEDEIADAIIRLFDLCGAFKIDIEKHIAYKLRFNSMREYKHGKRY